jgi:hypothetical protein
VALWQVPAVGLDIAAQLLFSSSRKRLRSRSIQPSNSEAAFSSSSLLSKPRRSASKNARVRTL